MKVTLRNGKTYNTETAKMVADTGWKGDVLPIRAMLFKKRTGEFFLYVQHHATGTLTEELTPFSVSRAEAWVRHHAELDEFKSANYVAVFGTVLWINGQPICSVRN